MDLNSLLDQIVQWLSTVNPIWAAVAAVFVMLIKRGVIKLPFNIPLVSPPGSPSKALVGRLKAKLEDKFSQLEDDGHDPDDVYNHVVQKLREDPVKK